MGSDERNDIKESGDQTGKPYRKPELKVYGDLASLTGMMSTGGRDDGHPLPSDKT